LTALEGKKIIVYSDQIQFYLKRRMKIVEIRSTFLPEFNAFEIGLLSFASPRSMAAACCDPRPDARRNKPPQLKATN